MDAVDIPVVAAGGFHDVRGPAGRARYGAAGIAMGTRFLLTSDSTVPDAVEAPYLAAAVTDVTVTTAVDGLPHRMPRSELVDSLERSGRTAALLRAVRHAAAFPRPAGLSRPRMVCDRRAMRHGKDRAWSQVLPAATTPMPLKASMVDGRTDTGVMASGQVAGVIGDLPCCADLVDRIMAEAAAARDRLTGGRTVG
ncbi:hypothetical protein SSPO_012360 [Streptomyces antimycoticus]|uniref:Nitronate monooxygenase domain-containing protein n=1 Tax=Streptomyces antimycoticus TaxID=68175 RepID=A0A499UGF8_9ACTN|nr:hypothetical protein SSPO_012360 [Streptomyces antimycoticus]